MTDLLDAVDALTKPRRTPVTRSKNGITCVGETVTQEPLLDWLEGAVAGAVGVGGSKVLKSERNPIDADALYKFVLITNAIKDWARLAHSEIVKGDPSATLRKWFVKLQSSPQDENVEAYYARHMWTWVQQIESKITPQRVADLPDPCPVCGATEWWNPSTRERYYRPLIIEYPEGEDPREKGVASCRACAKTWRVGELADLLLEKQSG